MMLQPSIDEGMWKSHESTDYSMEGVALII